MVSTARFELATSSFGGLRSVQLSYAEKLEPPGIEPLGPPERRHAADAGQAHLIGADALGCVVCSGLPGRNRTCDIQFRKLAFCPLNYGEISLFTY
jgi:hypothetical protein